MQPINQLGLLPSLIEFYRDYLSSLSKLDRVVKLIADPPPAKRDAESPILNT